MIVKPTTLVTEGKAEFNEILAKTSGGNWCQLLWQDSGQVILLSDYGNWAHWWGYRSGQSVPEFLAKLDRDYMGNKFLGSAIDVMDLDATVKSVRKLILFSRRKLGMDTDTAREEWELADRLADGELSFDVWFAESTMGEGHDCYTTRVSPTWEHFWNRLWVPFVVPQLQKYGKGT